MAANLEPLFPGGPFTPPEVRLLGKNVQVTLSRADGSEPAVIARGRLLAFSAMGEVVLECEDGEVYWCWPRLDVEEVPNAAAEDA